MESVHSARWWTRSTAILGVSAVFAVVTAVTGVRLFLRVPEHPLADALTWVAFAGWLIVPIMQVSHSLKRLQRLADDGKLSDDASTELQRSVQVLPVLGYVPLLVGLALSSRF
jgi:hypothetical protein